jgi:hypothetical protein
MIIAGQIKNIDEWFKKAGPLRGIEQWKDAHSAKEFAKKVLDNTFIHDIMSNILNKISINQNILFSIPEFETSIDNYGEPRHHDLVLFSENDIEKIGICFEAKVNEDFDEIISKKWIKGTKNGSKYHERINNMSQIIFGKIYDDELMGFVKYQLMTGTMGTIKFAEENKLSKCVFCIYQMEKSNDEIIKEHEKDLKIFFELLGLNTEIQNNSLFGPLKLTNNIELYISYLKRKL